MRMAFFRVTTTAGWALVLAAGVIACQQDVAAPGQTATTTAPSRATAANTKVAKIVFIGKKNACDCTRRRVDDSFAVLKTALGGRSDIAVQRLQVDVDPAGVEQYKKMRPVMVLPAIYLLGGSGTLVDVLQGEVAVEQVRKAIDG